MIKIVQDAPKMQGDDANGARDLTLATPDTSPLGGFAQTGAEKQEGTRLGEW